MLKFLAYIQLSKVFEHFVRTTLIDRNETFFSVMWRCPVIKLPISIIIHLTGTIIMVWLQEVRSVNVIFPCHFPTPQFYLKNSYFVSYVKFFSPSGSRRIDSSILVNAKFIPYPFLVFMIVKHWILVSTLMVNLHHKGG